MKLNKPLVSIVVPVYNVAKYLHQCVDSLIQQTYDNLEIILVNDGSTDISGSICDEYAIKDARVKVIHQKNQGLSGARNSGTDASTGFYLTYIDSDDWFELNTCELAVNKAIEGDYDLVMWQMIKEYESGKIYAKGPFGSDKEFRNDDFTSLHRRLFGPINNELKHPNLIDSFASAWGKLYKLSIIKLNYIRSLDTRIVGSEDILFNAEYFNYCNSSFYLHRHLIHYRKDNPTSLTKTHGSTLFPRFVNLFNYLKELINKHDLGEEFKNALNNRIGVSMMNIGLSEVSPRNQKTFREKISALNSYLDHDHYKISYNTFPYYKLGLHWRLFYLFCKWRFGTGVYFMLKGMRLFIK
ncbi:MAG: glycosyltransferase family 2 protein [Saprospiraceae bacterium]|nr:glycosyltransferase family 2 protein [Saprospiraceae bacterium]